MRIQLGFILIFSFISNSLFASTDEIKALFKNYELIMENKKTDLISETFTKKFINASGGLKKFEKNIKSLSVKKELKKITINPSKEKDVYYVEYEPESKKESTTVQFIIIKDEKKFKIDETVINEE